MRTGYPVAVHLFLLKGDHVLLLRRFNTGYEDGNYSVVAGHVERGETVTQAAVREAYEEAGIRISREALRPCGVLHRGEGSERVDFFFATDEWEGTISNREPEKCSALEWHPITTPPPNTIPYIRHALSNFSHGQWYDEFGF